MPANDPDVATFDAIQEAIQRLTIPQRLRLERFSPAGE